MDRNQVWPDDRTLIEAVAQSSGSSTTRFVYVIFPVTDEPFLNMLVDPPETNLSPQAFWTPVPMDIIGLPRKVVSAAEVIYRVGDDVVSPLVDFAREQPKTTAVVAITAALATAALRRNLMSYSDDTAFVSESLTGVQSKVRLARDLPQVPGELSAGGKEEVRPKTFEEVMGLEKHGSRMESLTDQAKRDQDALARLGFPRLNIFA